MELLIVLAIMGVMMEVLVVLVYWAEEETNLVPLKEQLLGMVQKARTQAALSFHKQGF